jgi:hypothetical protein
MSIKQKMQDQKVELDVRRQLEQAIEQFCSKMNLKADEREDAIQFIVCELDDRDKLPRTVAFSSPARVSTDADIRNMVAEYLAEFSKEMDEIVAELTSLSEQAKDELAMLNGVN